MPTHIEGTLREDFANITIQSNPINVLLGIGQSIKLNLTSPDYYDLYIKLESIKNKKVNLTIQTIHEEIPKPKSIEISGNATENITEEKKDIDEDIDKKINFLNLEIRKLKMFIYIIIPILIIMIIVALVRKNKNKNLSLNEQVGKIGNNLKERKQQYLFI